mgnify:CR=1 FL=1
MKKYTIFALAALVFAACTTPQPEPEAPDPVMTVDVAEYEATNAAEELIFNIESNIDWYITTDADWIEFAPAEGNGNSAVVVSIAKNENYDARESVITIAADVRLMEPGSIARSQGKGKHVIDNRTLE